MRAKGEGSIYQRGDGRWVAVVYDQLGKRRYLYAATEGEAVQRKKAADREGLPISGGLTVGGWLQSWLDSAKITARTREGYTSKINRLTPLIGHKRLDKLTPGDLDETYKRLRKDLSERSVLHCHRVLHTALAAAVRRGVITRNVAALVDSPRPGKYRASPFTADDARTLLAEAAGRRNGARWWFALLLGMRNGEVLGLRWEDLDLQHRTVKVQRQLQRHAGKGLVEVDATKTRKDRTLPLPVPLVELLEDMDRTTGLVFVDVKGRPISPERDRRDWIELLAAARIPFVRIYDCRHTTATLLMEAGIPARVVADILGHSTVNLTLNTYTHVVDSVVAGALDRLTSDLTPHLTSDSPRKAGKARGQRRVVDAQHGALRGLPRIS